MPAPFAAQITRVRGGALKLHRGATFGEVSIVQCKAPLPRLIASFPGDWHDTCGNTYITRAPGNGLAAQSASKPGRGGARNRGDRPSHTLTTAHIANLSAAEGHSRAIGLPFTRMISIHWKAAGVPLESMADATGKFKESLVRWLHRRGYQTAWLWVHENAGDKGWHCHLLAYVPADLVPKLVAAQKRWLRRITGRPYGAKVIRSDPIGGRLRLETGNPALHFENARAALAYVCKGAPQPILNAAGMDRQHAPQGLILGRRCSTSQNIAAKARKAKD